MWISLQCSDHYTAVWYFITVLHPNCSCAGRYNIFVFYCKFSLINKMPTEGTHTYVFTRTFVLVCWSIWHFALVRRWKVENDSKQRNWVAHVNLSGWDGFLKPELYWTACAKDWGPLHIWSQWIYWTVQRRSIVEALWPAGLSGQLWRKGAHYSDKLPKKGEKYVKKCTQTAVWSD